jgi:endonuclease YncB( thermonuclease family)
MARIAKWAALVVGGNASDPTGLAPHHHTPESATMRFCRVPTSRKTAMPRFAYPWLLLLLTGCQSDWTTLVDTEAASRRESAPIVTVSEEQPEIPEQDVRADWLKGKVVRVSDGDTLDLLVDEEDGPRKIRIRLQGIDCPERGQPWGKRATEYLADLVHGETVEVLSIGEDRRHRLGK